MTADPGAAGERRETTTQRGEVEATARLLAGRDHEPRHLGLYVHLHCLVTDGVFEDLGEAVRFLPADPPTPARMTAVLAQVYEAASQSWVCLGT